MKHMAWLGLFVGFALLQSGCTRNQTQAPTVKPPDVEVSYPVREKVANYEVFTGRTQAYNFADIRARATGYLKEAKFVEGEDVKEGALLFVIDPQPYDAALNQAKANVTLQQAQLTYNEADYNRLVDLRQNVSPDEVDKARAARDQAKAAVDAAKAAVKTAQINLDFTQVTAPFSGRIGRRLVDPGTDIQADVTVMASLMQVDPMYAYFDVNERTLLQIRGLLKDGKVPADAAEKFPVKLGFADERPEDYGHDGMLKFADNKVDPNTGTLRMWGTFKNPQHDLYSGLFIRVRMTIPLNEEEEKKWLFVSEVALGSDQGRKYVFVVKPGDEEVIARIDVEVGQRQNGLVAVKGLKGEERVVVNNLQRLRPDVKVGKIKPVEMPRAHGPATSPPIAGLSGSK